VEEVVDLHRRVFGKRAPRQELEGFLTRIFFDHPWGEEAFPSLAYVGASGRLVGCLGVMPRPMVFDGRAVQAVVTHNFIVAPEQRGGLPAIQLVRAMSSAGADLRLADENPASRRISEALGAVTVAPRSGRWLKVFRPTGLAVHLVEERMRRWHVGPLGRALSAASTVPDALLRVLPGSPTRVPRIRGRDEDAGVEALLDAIQRHTSHLKLRPVYTRKSLGWLLETLAATRQGQVLRARIVHADGEPRGWYIYYSRPGAVGRVLQLGGAPASRSMVLDHLFADAARERNLGLSGQIDPGWLHDLEAASCRLRPGRTWLVVRTSDPEIERTLGTPDAFVTRLESEAWLHFGY